MKCFERIFYNQTWKRTTELNLFYAGENKCASVIRAISLLRKKDVLKFYRYWYQMEKFPSILFLNRTETMFDSSHLECFIFSSLFINRQRNFWFEFVFSFSLLRRFSWGGRLFASSKVHNVKIFKHDFLFFLEFFLLKLNLDMSRFVMYNN